MKFKLEQIYAASKAIKVIDSTANPGKEALKISTRFTGPLMDHINKCEEQRLKLVKKYANGKQQNGCIEVTRGTENFDKFEKDFVEMLNEEIDVDIDLLSKSFIEKTIITPAEIRTLIPFIE